MLGLCVFVAAIPENLRPGSNEGKVVLVLGSRWRLCFNLPCMPLKLYKTL